MALIMYFKQVMEGSEDRSRYAIMQKVGMTRRQIKKGIDSERGKHMASAYFSTMILEGAKLSV